MLQELNEVFNMIDTLIMYFILVVSMHLQVPQPWQRDRASSIDDFKRRVNLSLKFRLKGYVSRHYDIMLT